MRLKLILAVALCALMLPACAAFQPVGDYLKDLGSYAKQGGQEFVGSFDVDVEGSKSGASVTVEAIGVSGSFGVNWQEIGCILAAGCENPEPELQPREPESK